jgi:hypothetical protein
MKFWPWGIITGLATYVIFVLTVVILLSKQGHDMVIEDYYKDDIQFREKLNEMKNTAALEDQIEIEYLLENDMIRLKYPAFFNGKTMSGTIWFYRPSDKNKDVSLPISPDSDLVQIIPGGLLEPGLWRVKINWQDGTLSYYDEHSLLLKK